MKRALTLVLVLAMVLGFAGVAFAATAGEIAGPAFSDIAGHQAEGELTLMAALGVMNGDKGVGGPVRPDDGITRAEFAKMMVAALGKSSTAAGLAGLTPNFKDQVPAWAWGWVNAAYYMGLVRGDDKGNFRPAAPVTYAEVMAVLIRSVRGHEAQLPAGVWPYNYIFYGVDAGFNGPVDVGFPNLPATRGDVARMLFAMMRIDRLDKDGKAEAGTSFLAGRVHEGLFEAYAADHSTVTIAGHAYPTAGKVYVDGAADYEGLLNLNVRAVTDAAGKVIFLQVVEANNVATGTFAGLTTKDSKTYIKLADGTLVPYTGTVTVNLNKEGGFDQGDLTEGDQVTISLNEDGLAAHVVAFRYDVAVDYLTGVTKSTGGSSPTDTVIALKGGASYNVPAAARVTVNGTAAGRDSLAAYDVVYVATKGAAGAEVIAVKAIRQVVQGTVKSTATTYPGPKYNVTVEKTSGGTATYRWNPAKLGATLPAAGTIIKIGLNEAGELYAPIGFTTATPYVMITEFSIDGASHMTVTVDSRGQSVTYASTVDLHTQIGALGKATIDGATNTVTAFSAITVSADPQYEVLALDAARGTMTVKNLTSGAISFVSDANVTIYKATDSGYAFAGFAGLKVGDKLTSDASGMIWVIGQ